MDVLRENWEGLAQKYCQRSKLDSSVQSLQGICASFGVGAWSDGELT